MKITGLGIDYSNICKDYNTMYLDRDNTDPETKKCMKKILTWTNEFLSELLDDLEYKLYHVSSDTAVEVIDIASKRFLFYSLEKEIMLQSYVIHSEYIHYDNLIEWELDNHDSILIKNDEDGGSIYFFFNENSKIQEWLTTKLSKFSLDEVTFHAK